MENNHVGNGNLGSNDDKEWKRRMKEEFAKAKQGIGETNKDK